MQVLEKCQVLVDELLSYHTVPRNAPFNNCKISNVDNKIEKQILTNKNLKNELSYPFIFYITAVCGIIPSGTIYSLIHIIPG
jgi:hypothetical protein